MIARALAHRFRFSAPSVARMSTHLSNGAANGVGTGDFPGVSLHDLPKSDVFTNSLPPDAKFEKPAVSHAAPREQLGPRMVKGALYTYVRPEGTQDPELLAVSKAAMKDIGLKEGEEHTEEFKSMVAGNSIFWDPATGQGIYPWAQCYGGSICPQTCFPKHG